MNNERKASPASHNAQTLRDYKNKRKQRKKIIYENYEYMEKRKKYVPSCWFTHRGRVMCMN